MVAARLLINAGPIVAAIAPNNEFAWAKKNNVKPPEYDVLRDPDETESEKCDRLRKYVAKKSVSEVNCGTSRCSPCDNQDKPKKDSERSATRKKKTFVLSNRDFKLASKITLSPCTLEVIAPDGTRNDLESRVVDMGSAEKEAFWSARMVADQKGIY